MKSMRKSSKGRYALVVGIASGFATLATFAIAIYNDTQAAVTFAGLAIACSLLALFLNSDEIKKEYCLRPKS